MAEERQTPDPQKIKQGILQKSGSRIASIPVDHALDPAAHPTRRNAFPQPGDEDPSREIQSAEIGMTFDGTSNSGSANLIPFIKRRLKQIADRMGDSDKEQTKPGKTGSSI